MIRFVAFLAVWAALAVSPSPGPAGAEPGETRILGTSQLVEASGERRTRPLEGGERSARIPVLLVPGWSDQAADVKPLQQRFIDAGWPESEVGIAEFDDPFGSNESHAREVADAVRELRARTGAGRVDVVAHSMGGLAVRYFLHFEGGKDAVRRVAFLGTPHFGTAAAILAWGAGGREMVPGSRFLERLNRTDPIPVEIEALALRTPVDFRVIPASSAILPGATNREVCCPTHQGMVNDERTFRELLAFLQAAAAVTSEGG